MDIDEKFLKEFVTVTQQASIATLPKIGKKNKNEVDKLCLLYTSPSPRDDL